MKQTMIYEFLGVEQDPLYEKLKKLKIGESFYLMDLTITLNQNIIYEISSEDIHRGFGDVFVCYGYLNELLKEKEGGTCG